MKDLFCAWKEKFHFKENVIFLFRFPSSTFFLSYMYVSANKNVDDSTGQNADVQIFLSRIQMLCQKYNSPKVLLSSFLFLLYTKPISVKKKKKRIFGQMVHSSCFPSSHWKLSSQQGHSCVGRGCFPRGQSRCWL